MGRLNRFPVWAAVFALVFAPGVVLVMLIADDLGQRLAAVALDAVVSALFARHITHHDRRPLIPGGPGWWERVDRGLRSLQVFVPPETRTPFSLAYIDPQDRDPFDLVRALATKAERAGLATGDSGALSCRDGAISWRVAPALEGNRLEGWFDGPPPEVERLFERLRRWLTEEGVVLFDEGRSSPPLD